jgi:hypothetical protein
MYWEINFWLKGTKSDDPDACWLWTGGRDRDGYGLFKIPDIGTRGAHRISMMLAADRIEAVGV